MSALEFAVRSLLLADGTVSGFVGVGDAARIYPQVLAQGVALPAITYRRISNTPDATQAGPGIDRARVEVNAWSKSYSEAKALAAAISAVLCPRRQPDEPAPSRVVNGIEIKSIVPANDRDMYEDDTEIHRVQADFFVNAATAAS